MLGRVFKNVTWLCTHVVQAEAEFKFRLGSIDMLNNSMFTKFTYIQPWNMTFEDLYEDYWIVEASAKISWGFYPLISSQVFSHVLSRCRVNGQDQHPNYVQLDHHLTSMYNKFNKAQVCATWFPTPYCFLCP